MRLGSFVSVVLAAAIPLSWALPIATISAPTDDSLEARQSADLTLSAVISLCDTLVGQIIDATDDNGSRRSRFTSGVVNAVTTNYPDWNIVVAHDPNGNDAYALANGQHHHREMPTESFIGETSIGFELWWFPKGYSSWYSHNGDGTLINIDVGGCLVSANDQYYAFC